MSDPIHCPITAVTPPNPATLRGLEPLLEHLRADIRLDAPRTFPVGTVLADGRLDLCKQRLGPAGCREIAQALAANTSTLSLLLGTNAIGDEGAAEVARLIAANGRLEIIYLGCNYIGPAGIAPLAAALADNPAVSGLWLKRNPIGDAGVLALAEMLRSNRRLRTLDP
jgi:hypothetical protein